MNSRDGPQPRQDRGRPSSRRESEGAEQPVPGCLTPICVFLVSLQTLRRAQLRVFQDDQGLIVPKAGTRCASERRSRSGFPRHWFSYSADTVVTMWSGTPGSQAVARQPPLGADGALLHFSQPGFTAPSLMGTNLHLLLALGEP